MLTITALLHTENDALRLGRCLETLYPCDDIVVVDHASQDATVYVAREYGARVVRVATGSHFEFREHSFNAPALGEEKWLLCLDPSESLSEALAASLFELKSGGVGKSVAVAAFSVLVREEGADGWIENRTPQTRLVPRGWNRWQGWFPVTDATATALEGDLLRFAFP